MTEQVTQIEEVLPLEEGVKFSDSWGVAVSHAAGFLFQAMPDRCVPVGPSDNPLLERKIVRKQAEGCVYVHIWHRSDPDDPHDHPWDFVSIVLEVGYWEITDEGRVWCPPGSIRFRKATDQHRIEIPEGQRPVSLIVTGPRIREQWGFHTADGYVPSEEYRSRAMKAVEEEPSGDDSQQEN